MATSDDRLVDSSVYKSMNANPIGLVVNQLIVMTMFMKQAFGFTDEDFTLLDTPTPSWISGTTTNPTTNAVNP